MKSIFMVIGLLAVCAIALAETEKKELTENGLDILNKLQALKQQEDDALASLEDEAEKTLISTILDKEEDEADKIEKIDDSTRVKRRARGRGRRLARVRAARRRFYRRLRRNQRRAARKRIAHARRHRQNQRRAAAKLRNIKKN
ncbi:hypothetical protein GCK32_005131 [Trichostrongylus colubriformis]|uniref:Uncharacterized protein n=1 Tax=Trichostrongylus colubriformis TaxID=6319 RepID=A0AAN8FF96_TRICO